MAISVVQRANNKTTGFTSAITATISAPTNGNNLIAVLSTSLANATPVTGFTYTGGTWVKAVSIEYTGPNYPAGGTADIWYLENVSGGGTGVQANTAVGTASRIMEVVEVSGLRTASSLDKTASTTSDDVISSVLFSTGTTAALSQSDEFAIGVIWVNNGTATATTSTGTLTLVTTILNTTDQMEHMEQITTTTTAKSGTVGLNPTPLSFKTCGAIATFKGASTATSYLPLLGVGV